MTFRNPMTRFHDAQADPDSGHAAALAEIRSGRKQGHWIWYVLPQLNGLGFSGMAQFYAIRSLDEACDYLRDPALLAHYEEIAGAIAERVGDGVPVEILMNGRTDTLKLVSSLTLFRTAAARLVPQPSESDLRFARLAALCDALLQATEAQGYPPCAFTLERIA
jgi:uncharacterized protein (DUF1810 family)